MDLVLGQHAVKQIWVLWDPVQGATTFTVLPERNVKDVLRRLSKREGCKDVVVVLV